jgi:F420-0:gamma-glutamyl ligase
MNEASTHGLPLRARLSFQPDDEETYEIVWLAPAGAELAAGEEVVRARRGDGGQFSQAAPFALRVAETFPRRRAVKGDPLLRCEVPSIELEAGPLVDLARDAQMQLAQAVNAAFKGLVALDGQGGHIAKSAMPVRRRLHPEQGEPRLLDQIVAALAELELIDGDVIVVSESLFAIAQGRLFPLELLYEMDPKTMAPPQRLRLLERIREHVPDVVEEDLVCADALPHLSPPRATAGMRDPNSAAHRLASAVRERLGPRCDVVISDTDTGLEVREPLIGCITISSTPLGATAGLILYECLRVACAAEFCRGSSRGIPIVVCRPHERRVAREKMGEPRGYRGRLDFAREGLIGYA